jgi:hypothetical protein
MPLGRRVATAALLLMAALIGLPASVSSALAADGSTGTTEASHWAPAGRVVPRQPALLNFVSCAGLKHCTAVDDNGDASVFGGHGWGPIRAADHDLGPLNAISCPTKRFCAAVGGRREVVRKKNGVWGRVHAARADLNSVSCWAASRCRAVGSGGGTVRYDGTWHNTARVGSRDLVAVSCSARDACTAITVDGTAYRLHGGRWHSQGPVFSGYGIRAISLDCPAVHLCMAATNGARVSRWNGRSWKQHKFWHLRTTLRDGAVSCSGPHFCGWVASGGVFATWKGQWGRVSYHPSMFAGTVPQPLSCPAPGQCLVVGEQTTVVRHGFHLHATPHPVYPQPRVACADPRMCMSINGEVAPRIFRRGHWSVQPGRQPAGGPVSCPSPTFCAAPGQTWDGTTWVRSGGIVEADVWSIDCVSASYCMAAGLYDDGDNPNEIWDGHSWSAIPESLESIAVACAGVSDCWTMSSSGDARHWDGTSWGPTEQLFSTLGGRGVECPTSGFCLAWGGDGEVTYLRDGVWGGAERVAPMVDVSCASATSCVGMLSDRPGFDATYDGTAWSIARALPRGYGGTITDLSCVGQGTCMAVDRQGNAWRRTT